MATKKTAPPKPAVKVATRRFRLTSGALFEPGDTIPADLDVSHLIQLGWVKDQ